MASSEIFLYNINEYATIDHCPTATCEAVCNLVCRKLKVQPIVELLFGLRPCGSRNFVAPCQPLVAKQKYEFRIRYKLPDVTKLKDLDKELFKYYFSQVKHDLLENKIPHLQYEEHSRKIMGLVLTDMYLEMVQNKVSPQELMGRYKRYVPKVIMKKYTMLFVKRAIKKELDMIEKFDHDPFYIIQSYISEISNIAPEYLTEEYSASTPYLRERDQTPKRNSCPVTLRISPYHADQPGLRVHYAYKNMWHNITIENMSGIEMHNLEVRIITQNEREKFVLTFKDRDSMESFVSCLSGYYRLMVKWSVNLCAGYPSPSLQELEKMRCHGPIGKEFAYKKIQLNSNESGSFLVRTSEEQYDVYFIDIAFQKDDFRTFTVTYRDGKFYLLNANGETAFANLLDAAKSINVPSEKHVRLTLSEYDKSSKLLLCRCSPERADLTLVKEVAEMRQGKALLINAQRELQLDESTEVDREGGVLSRMHGYFIVNEKSKVKVSLNILKPSKRDFNLEAFMHMADKWSSLNSPDLMKMYGFTLYQPIAMVMESTGMGPLNKYLSRVTVTVSALLDIVYSLLKAIVYLQDHNMVHNNIRCASIPWIPQEYHKGLDLSRYDLQTDIWACATTMWEIFSRGASPLSYISCFKNDQPPRLPKPKLCPDQLYDEIMCQGWVERELRFKPQSVLIKLHCIKQKSNIVYTDVETVSTTESQASGISAETEEVSLHQNGDHSIPSSGGSDLSINSDRHNGLVKTPNGLHPTHWLGRSDDGFFPKNIFKEKDYEILYQGQIGCGNYGNVFRGEVHEVNDSTHRLKVAIKVLNIPQNASGMVDFENECKIMKKLNHPNIVQIFDCRTENPNNVEIVMEYVEKSSLDNYLKMREIAKVKTAELLRFAKDIASGMEYLQLQKIVHRDLAARNVLVDRNERLKISDFGLARFVNIDGYYTCRDLDKKVPITWYAPETLSQMIYTVHSDVWSYGVTLYEIFSGGMDPCLLKGEQLSADSLLKLLNDGVRLQRPPYCPRNIYEKLMLPCWAQRKTLRPTFTTILDTIDKLTPEYGEEV
uniref:non-specific protein-tyrosine kinase n=2 Tax=Lutzomyia longipalpis TaxID=7200 RepID=A0A1B0CSM3_LUTLO